MLNLKKSIHLDSLRQPFRTAIVTAASMGADAVEINGTTEVRPSEMSRTAIRQVRKLLADLNLKVSAIHFPTRLGFGDLDQLDRRIEATKSMMNLAFELGCNVVVKRIGKIAEQPDDPRWLTMIQALADLGNFSQKSGAWLAARTGAEPGKQLRVLIDALPAHSLKVDFDPAELVINGHSPGEAIDVLAEFVTNCRARDAVTDLSLGRGVETPLGEGSVDWPHLLARLEQQSYPGYLTAESSDESRAHLHCAHAIRYLEGLFS